VKNYNASNQKVTIRKVVANNIRINISEDEKFGFHEKNFLLKKTWNLGLKIVKNFMRLIKK
jgi:hypothetical protein